MDTRSKTCFYHKSGLVSFTHHLTAVFSSDLYCESYKTFNHGIEGTDRTFNWPKPTLRFIVLKPKIVISKTGNWTYQLKTCLANLSLTVEKSYRWRNSSVCSHLYLNVILLLYFVLQKALESVASQLFLPTKCLIQMTHPSSAGPELGNLSLFQKPEFPHNYIICCYRVTGLATNWLMQYSLRIRRL